MWTQDKQEGNRLMSDQADGEDDRSLVPAGPVTREDISASVGNGAPLKGMSTYHDTVRIDVSLDGDIPTEGAGQDQVTVPSGNQWRSQHTPACIEKKALINRTLKVFSRHDASGADPDSYLPAQIPKYLTPGGSRYVGYRREEDAGRKRS